MKRATTSPKMEEQRDKTRESSVGPNQPMPTPKNRFRASFPILYSALSCQYCEKDQGGRVHTTETPELPPELFILESQFTSRPLHLTY